MNTKPPDTASAFKAAVATTVSVGFLIASVVVTFRTRHYQVSGQSMPNGKGGFMTPGDGYLIGAVLFAISVAWLLAARRFRRERPE